MFVKRLMNGYLSAVKHCMDTVTLYNQCILAPVCPCAARGRLVSGLSLTPGWGAVWVPVPTRPLSQPSPSSNPNKVLLGKLWQWEAARACAPTEGPP